MFGIKYIWEFDPRPSAAINTPGVNISLKFGRAKKNKMASHRINCKVITIGLTLCFFFIYDHKNVNAMSLSPGKKRSPLFFCLFLSLLLTLFSHNQKLEDLLR